MACAFQWDFMSTVLSLCYSYCSFSMLRKMLNTGANDRQRSAKYLEGQRCYCYLLSVFQWGEKVGHFTDANSSCGFRISICMLNIDIGCVVPVSLPLIWLNNRRLQARQNCTGGTEAQTPGYF